MGTQSHLPPNSIFSSDFGHFILKMLDYSKMLGTCVKKKVAEMSQFLGGRPPLISRLRGRVPRPPAFWAHAYGMRFKQSIA